MKNTEQEIEHLKNRIAKLEKYLLHDGRVFAGNEGTGKAIY